METTKAVKHLVADESKLHQLFPLSANEGLKLLPQVSNTVCIISWDNLCALLGHWQFLRVKIREITFLQFLCRRFFFPNNAKASIVFQNNFFPIKNFVIFRRVRYFEDLFVHPELNFFVCVDASRQKYVFDQISAIIVHQISSSNNCGVLCSILIYFLQQSLGNKLVKLIGWKLFLLSFSRNIFQMFFVSGFLWCFRERPHWDLSASY